MEVARKEGDVDPARTGFLCPFGSRVSNTVQGASGCQFSAFPELMANGFSLLPHNPIPSNSSCSSLQTLTFPD